MNDSPRSTIQAAGQVATDVVAGLKQNPLILGLIVLQFLTMGAVLYNSLDRQRAISAQFASLYKLLEACMAGAAAGKELVK